MPCKCVHLGFGAALLQQHPAGGTQIRIGFGVTPCIKAFRVALVAPNALPREHVGRRQAPAIGWVDRLAQMRMVARGRL